jgi:lipoprotein-releasing system ATP-binding protein
MMQGALSSTSVRPVLLRAEGVWKSYEHNTIPVLRGVDFTGCAGETIALCGPSGCGKSTLLHLLGGLDEPDRGVIAVAGRPVRGRSELLHLLRHEVGFVFQLHNLIPGLTVQENCMLPAVAAGIERGEARDRLRRLADATGLAPRLHQRIEKLSGGERQRTALCRALMNRPRLLLADEPTGSLDDQNRDQVFQLLLDLAGAERITLVMATHDRELAQSCSRLLIMKEGQIRESA